MAIKIPKLVLALCILSASAYGQPHRTSRHPEGGYSGSINRNSLGTMVASPTITGSFSGAGGVGIVIVKGGDVLPKRGSFSNIKNTANYGFSDHGGDIELEYANNSITSGTFSYTIKTLLTPGTYTVGEYVFGGGWARAKLVATAILTVH